MNSPILAFDKGSVRSYDKDGRLHVALTNISKSNVCPYLGREIPGWQELGLDPKRVYRMYRDAEELAKGASTFNNIQLMQVHEQVSADDPKKEEIVGSIGSDVVFNHPYLQASLCVWDAEAIANIEAEAIEELSSAYHYKPVMEPGTSPDGEDYDGRMTEIIGNHVALVEKGRAGSDVVVADSDPFFQKEITMKQTKLGKALHLSLAGVSPKIAADSALPGLVADATRKNVDAKAIAKHVLALDNDLVEEVVEGIIEAVVGVEAEAEETPEPIVQDETDNGAPSKHAEIIDYLRKEGLDASKLEAVGNMLTRMDRPYGEDEVVRPEEVEKRVEEEVKTAMDSMRKEFRDLELAKSQVRGVVGDVIGMDSAEEVYRFALDHLKVDHKGMPASGLKTLFSVAASKGESKPKALAMDSVSIVEQIPGLARFG